MNRTIMSEAALFGGLTCFNYMKTSRVRWSSHWWYHTDATEIPQQCENDPYIFAVVREPLTPSVGIGNEQTL